MYYAENEEEEENETCTSFVELDSQDSGFQDSREGENDPKQSRMENSECDPDHKQRKKILNEIYDTEKTYNHQLTLLTTIFLHPLNISQILPPQIVEGLFSNVEAIHTVSTSLLKLMEERGVVHALLDLAPYMKLYSIYANNFNTSQKLLDELLTRSKDFRKLLKFQEAREEMESQKLSALLLTPIQRVPRYRLLLQNLLQKTREDDRDVIKLRHAYDEIDKVTSHINECVRQHENFNKMLQIQNAFVGPHVPQIIAPGRHFIREGPVMKISPKGKAKDRVLLLFNDLLICAKKETSSTYQCDVAYDLFTCYVEQLLGKSDNGTGLFKVTTSEKKYLLLCSQLEEKSWVKDIKEAIKKLHANYSSLRRGSFVMSAVSYENLRTRKVKTTPRRIGTRILDFNNSGRKSPVFNSIANRPSTKRESILVSPNTSVFDTLQNRSSGLAKPRGLSKSTEVLTESIEESCENDLINTSINSISDFVQKNSFLFESTSTVGRVREPIVNTPHNIETELTMEPGTSIISNTGETSVSECRTQVSPVLSPPMDFTPTAEWTVTEKSGDSQDLKPSQGQAMEELKILCIGKQVPSLDVTSQYIKSAQCDVRYENLETESSSSSSSGKKDVNNNSTSSNCLIM